MVDKQKIGTFVLGGVAGALAGILLAPKSGKDLRGSIANRAGEARERSRETYFDAQERMQERFAKTRERGPRGEGDHHVRAAGDTLPKFDLPGSEPLIETPMEEPVESSLASPPLRAVSRDVPQEVTRQASEEEPDPEEIRRKIQEARSRLRARLDAAESEGSPGERDG